MVAPRPAVAWGAVVAVVGALISWPFFMGSRLAAVESKTAELENRVVRIERAIDANADALRGIDSRLSRIEGKLDEMRRGR